MKEKILEIYRTLKPEVRAGICDIAMRLVWAAEHDPEILPLILTRPSEQAAIEQYAEEIGAARDAIIAAHAASQSHKI